MEDVAAAAGVTRGLLHHYFGTKRDLHLELMRDMLRAIPVPVPEFVQGATPDQRMAESVDRWLDAIWRNRRMWLATLGGAVLWMSIAEWKRTAGEADKPGAPRFKGLGDHKHPISTKNPQTQTLFNQGAKHDGIYLIESGRIRVFYTSPLGREITLAYWRAGNFVGGPEVFGGGIHQWSGIASSNACVVQLPGKELRTLATEIPNLAIGLIDGLAFTNRASINALALNARLPTMHGGPEPVAAGGLISYGPNFPALWRRSADYIDKILRGDKPGDIPVEQPAKFDLVVNLKTAKALGLTMPITLIGRADELIE